MHVRRATLDDIDTIRSLRLQALTDSPDAFGSTYARELARSDDDWRRWIEPNPTYLLDDATGEAVGIVAATRDEEDQTTTMLMALWIRPASRGSGGGDLLVNAVLHWATVTQSTSVQLCVIDGNGPAQRLYERHGFVVTGHEKRRDRDACAELEMTRPMQ